MLTVFKENLNLQQPLIFYSSIRFVCETVFTSELIAENRFGVLLEISDKFITKFNVFSYIILLFRLKTGWKISKPYCIAWGKCFCKNVLHGETNVFGKIYGRKFYIRTNDQIMQGRKLMLQRFQRSSQVSFPLIDPDLGYCYII